MSIWDSKKWKEPSTAILKAFNLFQRETANSATLSRARQSLPADLLPLLRKGCKPIYTRHLLLSSAARFSQRMLRDADYPTGTQHQRSWKERKTVSLLASLLLLPYFTYVNWDYKHNLSLHESNYTNNFNHIPVPVVSPILLKRGKRDFQSSIWGKRSPLRDRGEN